MGLAGQLTAFQKEWNNHPYEEDFMSPPVNSGFYQSGIVQATAWAVGPGTGPLLAQTSGVSATQLSGAIGGQVQLLAGAAAAAEGTLYGPQTFGMASGGSLYFRSRIRIDEVTTSGALACAVGLASAPWQSGMTLPGGLRTSGVAFAVGKLSGTQTFAMMANVGTSGVAIQSTANAAGSQSGQFYDVEGFLNSDRGNVTQFTAKVNGQFLRQGGLSPFATLQPIVISLPQDSTAMGLFVGVKEGAGEAAGVTVDKIFAEVGTNYP